MRFASFCPLFLAVFTLGLPQVARAYCFGDESSCEWNEKSRYQSDISSCSMLHDNPRDTGWLNMCVDRAKVDYDRRVRDCKAECREEEE